VTTGTRPAIHYNVYNHNNKTFRTYYLTFNGHESLAAIAVYESAIGRLSTELPTWKIRSCVYGQRETPNQTFRSSAQAVRVT